MLKDRAGAGKGKHREAPPRGLARAGPRGRRGKLRRAWLAVLLPGLLAGLLLGACDPAAEERARVQSWSQAGQLGGLRVEARAPLLPAPGAEQVLTVAVTGDLKGWITTSILYPERNATGLAHLAPHIRALRAADPGLILLDAGDALHGAPSATLVAAAGGLPALDFPALTVMNMLGYDAVALGNYDFALGWPALAQALSRSHFPWLSANLERTGRTDPPVGGAADRSGDGGGTALPPYRVLERHGVRVGVLGLTTPAAGLGRHPRQMDGLIFGDLEAAARRWVPILRKVERVDVLIGLLHSGLDGDFARDDALRAGTPLFAAAGRLAAGPLGFDLIVAGDAQRLSPRASTDGSTPWGTPVVEPGARGNGLAVARLHLAEDAGRWRVRRVERHTLRAEAVPDPQTLALVAEPLAQTARRLAEPTAMRFRARPRKGEFYRCAGALSHATAVWLAGTAPPGAAPSAPVSLLPMRWDYRPLPKDAVGTPVRRAHLYRWMRYGESLVQVRLTGRQVALLLEGWVRHTRGWRVPAPEVLWPGGLRVELPPKGSEAGLLALAAAVVPQAHGGLRSAVEPAPEADDPAQDDDRTAAEVIDALPRLALAPHATLPVWLTAFVAQGGLGLAPRVLLDPRAPPLREVPTTLRAGLFALLSDPAFVPPPECARWLGP